jgi:hypothetical protein
MHLLKRQVTCHYLEYGKNKMHALDFLFWAMEQLWH